jgi:uncharacterized membrane protein (UPF0182 family)
MEPTLEAAMRALVGSSVGAAEPGADTGSETLGREPPQGDAELARRARATYERAVAAQRRGDWTAYGLALEELGRLLESMSAE